MIITLYSRVIYAYICSMVKEYVRTENTDKFVYICAHTSTACNCGADVRNRNARDALAYGKDKIENHLRFTINL